MTLGQKQRLFVLLTAKLINWAYENGYELTTGDGYRDERAFGKMGEKGPYGKNNSNHKRRLAHDWNLFKDGVYLTETEDHRPLGEYWESLHPDNVWGGRFNDGNHYSMKYAGYY